MDDDELLDDEGGDEGGSVPEDDESFEDEPMEDKDESPPSSVALHDLHDAYGAVGEVVAHHLPKVEHPQIKSYLKKAMGHAADLQDEVRELHGKHHPDAEQPEAPEDEDVEEPAEGAEDLDEKYLAEDEHPLKDDDDEMYEPRRKSRGRTTRKSDDRAEALARTNRRAESKLIEMFLDANNLSLAHVGMDGLSQKSRTPRDREGYWQALVGMAVEWADGRGVDLDAYRHPDLADPLSRKSLELADHLREKDDRLLGQAAMLPPDEQQRVLDALGGVD